MVRCRLIEIWTELFAFSSKLLIFTLFRFAKAQKTVAVRFYNCIEPCNVFSSNLLVDTKP